MAVATLTDDARQRIAKLIPSLSHMHAGEVAATAAAIGRALAKVGADWHDLAAVIRNGGMIAPGPTISQRAQAGMRTPPPQYRDQVKPGFGEFREFSDIPRPRPPRPPRRPFEGEQAFAARTQAEYRHRKSPKKGEVWGKELSTTIDEIERAQGGYLDGLGERAFTFLEQMRGRCEKYETVKVSAKQDRWIRAIAQENGVTIPWTEIEDE